MHERVIKHFVIENRIGELSLLADKIEVLTREWNLTGDLAMKINLVLEEALSNIVFYAFNDNGKHEIKISLSLKNKNLVIKIIDDGIPFDPTLHQKPDLTLPAGERPVGGLGILIISEIMDAVHYKRNKNINILTLKKYLA